MQIEDEEGPFSKSKEKDDLNMFIDKNTMMEEEFDDDFADEPDDEDEEDDEDMEFELDIENKEEEKEDENMKQKKQLKEIQDLLKIEVKQLNIKITKATIQSKDKFMLSKTSLNKLSKLSKSFFSSVSSDQYKDYGITLILNYKKFIRDFGRITIHEQKSTQFMRNLLHYLFNGVLKRQDSYSEEAK